MKGFFYSLLAIPLVLISQPAYPNPYEGFGIKAEDDPYHLQEKQYFPEWPLLRRTWGLSPQIGFVSREEKRENFSRRITIAEGGLQLSLRDYTILSNNSPGLIWRPLIGFNFGATSQKLNTAGSSQTLNSRFSRSYVGAEFNYFYRYLRYRVQIRTGQISYDDNELANIRETAVLNDLGLRITQYLSTHLLYETSHIDSDNSNLSVHNLWLYAKYRLEALDMDWAFGPGLTFTDELNIFDEEGLRTVDIDTQYLLSTLNWNILWRFGFNAGARYVFGSTAPTGSLPLDLGQRPLAAPAVYRDDIGAAEDSLGVEAFIGIRRLFGSFGVGYQWQRFYDNYSDDDERRERSSQGFTVLYQQSY